MSLLFVTPMLPGTWGGSAVRIFNFIKHLSTRHDIVVLSFFQERDEAQVDHLRPYCAHLELVTIPSWQPANKWANRLSGWSHLLFDQKPQFARTYPLHLMEKPLVDLVNTFRPDLVHFDTLSTGELAGCIDQLPCILSEHNVEYNIEKRKAQIAGNPIHYLRDSLEWRKLKVYERRIVQRFHTVVAVSEADREHLKNELQAGDVHVVSNGVDIEHFERPVENLEADGEYIVFVGQMNYLPNVDGILYFVREIWPSIQKHYPDLTLKVVGTEGGPEVQALSEMPGISVTGYVNDIRPYLWNARLSIVPLRYGGGTRLKILEALAAKCPTVSTSIGAEGLALEPGRDLMISDTPEDFSKSILTLLRQRERSEALAENGYQTVKKSYNWPILARQLEAVFNSSIQTKEAQYV